MKTSELFEQDDILDEKLRHTVAAAALGASLSMPGAMAHKLDPVYEPPKGEITAVATTPKVDIPEPTIDRTELAKNIAKEYQVGRGLVQKIVDLAYRHEDKVFPKASDILAIISVESSFNPYSRSHLRRDPAIGLMQVRPGVWDLKPSDLSTIGSQIRHGTRILKRYYKKTGSAEDAVQAYNVGITKFRKGKRNPRYVAKYNNFLASNFNL